MFWNFNLDIDLGQRTKRAKEQVEQCKNALIDLNVKAQLVEKNIPSYYQSSSENTEMPKVNKKRFGYLERTTWRVEIQKKDLLQ